MNRLVVLPRALSQRIAFSSILSNQRISSFSSDLSNRGMDEDPEHVSQRIAEESWEAMGGGEEGGGGRGRGVSKNIDLNINKKGQEEEGKPSGSQSQSAYEKGQKESRKRDIHVARVEHEMERTGLEKGRERDKDFPYEQTDINDESGGPARNPLP